MYDIFLGFFCIIISFIVFNVVVDVAEIFIFGCGRKFKNGRKCSVWHCPNRKDCSFSK